MVHKKRIPGATVPRPVDDISTRTKRFSSQMRQASEESVLSKSLGNVASSFNRSSSEICGITYSGYLLKRSNYPHHHHQISSFPLIGDDDNLVNSVAGPLQLKQRVTSEHIGSSHEYSKVAPLALPQHLVVDESKLKEAAVDLKEKRQLKTLGKESVSPVAQASAILATFFGLKPSGTQKGYRDAKISLQTRKNEGDETNAPESSSGMRQEQPLPDLSTLSSPRARSAPISVRPPLSQPRTVSTQGRSPVPRRFSSPLRHGNIQEDIIDPNDGHIWRVKYCVLEDGILYFYHNATDGNSSEAQAERLKSSLLHTNAAAYIPDHDLSKSPMTRRRLSPNTARLLDDTGVIWEKKVPLDCVGAVRSAELEYGECSFELLAVEDNGEDDTEKEGWPSDKLVLRARNSEEMNEWLFQFHRSLYSFLQNIMDVVRSSPIDEFNHTSLGGANISCAQPLVASNELLNALSPRHHVVRSTSLSHGHGRNALHRRQKKKETESPSSTPGSSPTALRGGPLNQKAVLPPKVTPTTVERPERIEPAVLLINNDTTPDLKGSSATSPEINQPKPDRIQKYVPPHLRKRNGGAVSTGRYVPPHMRQTALGGTVKAVSSKVASMHYGSAVATRIERDHVVDHCVFDFSMEEAFPAMEGASVENRQRENSESGEAALFKLGGCADASLTIGSILDPAFKPRSASRVGQVHLDSYGSFGGGDLLPDEASNGSNLRWEIGAFSQCGVPKTNQDSYLVVSDLLKVSRSLRTNGDSEMSNAFWKGKESHNPGLFAIFDGHAGDQAARFAAERLPYYLINEFGDREGNVQNVEQVIRRAIATLDQEFCSLCTQDGRDWESGTTALIAVVAHEHIVIANLGDCRGIMCRSISGSCDNIRISAHLESGWTLVDSDGDSGGTDEQWIRPADNGLCDESLPSSCFFKEVTDIHCPSREDEHKRIKESFGWITTEKEIPIGQLQRMDFCDEDVVEILKRCFSDRYQRSQTSTSPKRFNSAPQRILHISRVCGELTVSRALGDRDFKSSANKPPASTSGESLLNDDVLWDGPSFLPYPENHRGQFKGDLVSAIPEVQTIRIGQDDVQDEFLLMACDGLWDVMDPDDAIRVTRGLLFEKKWTAKKAAARLTELGIHLGSSDNITVIVIRFFSVEQRYSTPI